MAANTSKPPSDMDKYILIFDIFLSVPEKNCRYKVKVQILVKSV